MWLLVPAILLLLFSSLLSAFMAEAYGKSRPERPLLMREHEGKLGCINVVFFIAGIGMLVVAVGWWGLAGIAIYWLLVVFVLMPIGIQRLLLLISTLREKQSTLPHGNRGETHLLHNLDRLKQLKDMSSKDIRKLAKDYKGLPDVAKLLEGIAEVRAREEAQAKVIVDGLEREVDELEQKVEQMPDEEES